MNIIKKWFESWFILRSDVDYIENQCTKHLPDCSYTAAKKVKTTFVCLFEFSLKEALVHLYSNEILLRPSPSIR